MKSRWLCFLLDILDLGAKRKIFKIHVFTQFSSKVLWSEYTEVKDMPRSAPSDLTAYQTVKG